MTKLDERLVSLIKDHICFEYKDDGEKGLTIFKIFFKDALLIERVLTRRIDEKTTSKESNQESS